MKGYKNSTKTVYETEESANYAKGGMAKVGKVMGEFKRGTLHSGSKKGPEVTNPKQAIAMSEARKAGAKLPMKKAEGGSVKKPRPYDPVKDEPTSRPLTADQVRNLRNRTKAAPPKKRAYDPVLDEPTSRPFAKGGSVKAAVHKHERAMHPGKPLTALKKGGVVEKGSGEVYASKGAMRKHEAKESAAMERAEHGKRKGGKVGC